jgi:hypothetical protein
VVSAPSPPFLSDLEATRDLSRFLSDRLFDSIPALFSSRDQFMSWRTSLASDLGVDPLAILIIGSAAVGLSMNPAKNFKTLDAASDVDIAVLSEFHFDVAWRYLRRMPARDYFRLPVPARLAVDAHVNKYVYFGTITTDRILAHLPFGALWFAAINARSKEQPTLGRRLNIRLYRDIDSLRSYQLLGFREAQQRLLESR